METQPITIYHSPDADDAFMFYGLTSGKISYPGYEFNHELCDIETLNQRTLRGELDVTAVSVHAFAYLKDQYVILNSGASMGGDTYGPRLIAKESFDLAKKRSLRIGIPGQYTSATLSLKLFLKEKGIEAELVNMYFEKVGGAVRSGEVDAGVIIHEGQLTYEKEGFVCLLDLGKWWWDDTKLPLPLGINVAKRTLGDGGIAAVGSVLKGTIEYSLSHRKEALDYALSYGRGISRSDADVFVGMYVNDLTVDMGETGRNAVRLFLQKGMEFGFIPEVEVVFAAN